MYAKGRVLIVGGGVGTISNSAEMINLTLGNSATWQSAGAMQYPRKHCNATLLPTGQVLVTGGTQSEGVNEYSAVLPAELWTPPTTTGTGTWQTLAPMQVPRLYHSTAVLLPDGRVLCTGGGEGAEFLNHPDYEVFSPPYLFSANPRPQIAAAPVAVKYNQQFSVTLAANVAISKARWIRLGSVTHAIDMNQRGCDLTFSQNGTALTITPPASADDWCPPGHYMLFLVSTAGVPSVSLIQSVSASNCATPTTLVLTPTTLSSTGCTTQMRVTATGQNLGAVFHWQLDGVSITGTANTLNFSQGLNYPSKSRHRVGVSVTPTCGGVPITAEIIVTSYFPDCLPD